MLAGLTWLVGGNATRSQQQQRRQQAVFATTSRRRSDANPAINTASLQDFRHNWAEIQSILRHPDQAALHYGVSRSEIPDRLEALGMSLISESTSVDEIVEGMGPCKEMLLKHDMLRKLVEFSASDSPTGLLIEVVKLYQILVANLDASFLSQHAVNKPLVRLIRTCLEDEDVDSAWGQEEGFGHQETSAVRRMSHEELEKLNEALVGLMAFVAAKLHNSQHLLHIFFHDVTNDSQKQNSGSGNVNVNGGTSPTLSSSSISTIKVNAEEGLADEHSDKEPRERVYDFPLFTYLLRFVHSESDTGSFARAGLSMFVKIAFETKPLETTDDLHTPTSTKRVTFSQDAEHSTSTDLAAYIVQSDFADVVGASLGAVYGLIPSKLAIVTRHSSAESSSDANQGMRLGAANTELSLTDRDRIERFNIELSSSPLVQTKLQLFVDLVEFVQTDVVHRIGQVNSAPVGSKTLLAHQVLEKLFGAVRESFLHNVLAPSMIESGDQDGTAVAVLSYIDVLISILQSSNPLTDEVIAWLLNADDIDPACSTFAARDHQMRNRRTGRKTAALSNLERNRRRGGLTFDPFLGYDLRSLILDNLASTTSHAGVMAALGLLSGFFAKQGRYAPSGLITVQADGTATAFPFNVPAAEYSRQDLGPPLSPGLSTLSQSISEDHEPSAAVPRLISLDQHFRELDMYFSLISMLHRGTADSPAVPLDLASSTGYHNYLCDAEESLLRSGSFILGSTANESVLAKIVRSPPVRHRLDPTDTLLRSVLARFRRFFEHPPELNLALVSALSAVTLCPYRALDSWATFDSEDWLCLSVSANREESEDWRTTSSVKSSLGPPFESGNVDAPIVLLLLRALVHQVERYQSSIPDFDRFLSERRRGLLYMENLSDALAVELLDPTSLDKGQRAQPSTSVPNLDTKRVEQVWAGVEWKSRKMPDDGGLRVVDLRDAQIPAARSEEGSGASAGGEHIDNETAAAAEQRTSTIMRLYGRVRGRSVQDKTQDKLKSSAASQPTPFADHYDQTTRITIRPAFIPMPPSPWTGSSTLSSRNGPRHSTPAADSVDKPEKRTRFQLSPSLSDDESEQQPPSMASNVEADASTSRMDYSAVFAYPGMEDDEREEAKRIRKRVSLSAVLDNVVILEEFIKELTAIIQVRRTLGIDAVAMF